MFVPLCSPTTCKDVFYPNVTTFQSNCAEGLHFSAFHFLAMEPGICICDIASEKTTHMAQNLKNHIFNVGLKLQVCSLFYSLFQAHSAFRCVVMGANARRCSRMQNETITYKRELPVKTLNIRILT